ncbi:MAG: putative MAP kinase kinase family domain protein, partial [Streblomastix strix]
MSVLKKSDFKEKKALGHGAFGQTYLIKNIQSGQKLVWKKMVIMNEQERKMAQDEADMLNRIKNDFLVKYYGQFEEKNEFFILMEYCDRGDLRQYINKLKNLEAVANEEKIWEYLSQTAEALYSLHSINIIHRDLKPENVFLTHNLQVKLGDLGMARTAQSTILRQTRIGGT